MGELPLPHHQTLLFVMVDLPVFQPMFQVGVPHLHTSGTAWVIQAHIRLAHPLPLATLFMAWILLTVCLQRTPLPLPFGLSQPLPPA